MREKYRKEKKMLSGSPSFTSGGDPRPNIEKVPRIKINERKCCVRANMYKTQK